MMTAEWTDGVLTLTSDTGLTVTGQTQDGKFRFKSPEAGTENNWPVLEISDGGGHLEFIRPGSLPATGLTVEVENGSLLVH